MMYFGEKTLTKGFILCYYWVIVNLGLDTHIPQCITECCIRN